MSIPLLLTPRRDRLARLSSGSARGIAPPAFTLAPPGRARAIPVKSRFSSTPKCVPIECQPTRRGTIESLYRSQNLDLQRDALKRSGCERLIEETASGGKVQRSGLERVQEMLREGDLLAVWRLERLGRSLEHLIEVMGGLEDQGIVIRVIAWIRGRTVVRRVNPGMVLGDNRRATRTDTRNHALPTVGSSPSDACEGSGVTSRVDSGSGMPSPCASRLADAPDRDIWIAPDFCVRPGRFGRDCLEGNI